MLEARIAQLQDRIAARDGKPGYKRNVVALKAELARLVQMQDEATFAAQDTAPAGESQESAGA